MSKKQKHSKKLYLLIPLLIVVGFGFSRLQQSQTGVLQSEPPVQTESKVQQNQNTMLILEQIKLHKIQNAQKVQLNLIPPQTINLKSYLKVGSLKKSATICWMHQMTLTILLIGQKIESKVHWLGS